jgi:mRNA interferase MazF
MKQREIWLVDLNPVRGSEQRGIRPVVVISGNAMNNHLEIAIVCPLTARIKNYMGCLVLPMNRVNGLDADSEVITFQIRTVSRERFLTRLGEITEEELKLIRERLMEVLTF